MYDQLGNIFTFPADDSKGYLHHNSNLTLYVSSVPDKETIFLMWKMKQVNAESESKAHIIYNLII